MKTLAMLFLVSLIGLCLASPVPTPTDTVSSPVAQQNESLPQQPAVDPMEHLVWFSNGKSENVPLPQVMESDAGEEEEEVVVIEDPEDEEPEMADEELAEGEEIAVKEPADMQPTLVEQPSELTEDESISVNAPLLEDQGEDRSPATESPTLELNEGEEITVREPNVVPEELSPLPLTESDVQVSEWHDTTTSPGPSEEELNMLIDSANSVSSPWQDVMVAGLPPSVAYNWQFLMDLSGKLRTADSEKQMAVSLTTGPTTPKDTSINTRLKYVIAKIQGAYPTLLPILDGKIDNLKQQHQLKTKLQTSGIEGDNLKWAWRRVSLSP